MEELTSVLQNSLHCSGGDLGSEPAGADAEAVRAATEVVGTEVVVLAVEELPTVTVVVAVTVTIF